MMDHVDTTRATPDGRTVSVDSPDLEGVAAVAKVRKFIVSTYPTGPPGTVRGDYAHQTKASSEVSGMAVMNLVHASGNSEEAKYEVDPWFGSAERFEYEILAEEFADRA